MSAYILFLFVYESSWRSCSLQLSGIVSLIYTLHCIVSKPFCSPPYLDSVYCSLFFSSYSVNTFLLVQSAAYGHLQESGIFLVVRYLFVSVPSIKFNCNYKTLVILEGFLGFLVLFSLVSCFSF